MKTARQSASQTTDTASKPNKSAPVNNFIATKSSHPMSILQRAQIVPCTLSHAEVMQLHGIIGNRAVAQLFSKPPAQKTGMPEKNDLLQKKSSSINETPLQRKENKTGLPDNLKVGIENLSGYSMDDVKVHYNSEKPAQLQAHAYTQGTDIHLGPGEERHLPHEAWHVVQQKEGRVKPTMQMKDKVNINNVDGLEKEADIMGGRARRTDSQTHTNMAFDTSPIPHHSLLQRPQRTHLDQVASSRRNIPTEAREVKSRRETDSVYNVQAGREPIQRAVVVGGELWAVEENMANSPLNNLDELAAMMEAIGGIEYLADPPANIQAAITDERFFHLWRNGGWYEADVTNYLANQGDPTNRQHLRVNTAPDFVHRGELPQTMRIQGLISCIAIFIEASNQYGTQLLIGMHYTTGYHTEENGDINACGTNALQAMALLMDGYQMARVHLCHPLQLNEEPNPATVVNLERLREHFGAGNCQTHVLAQTHVTARLGSNGNVQIDI